MRLFAAIRSMKRVASALMGTLFLILCLSGAIAEPNLTAQDSSARSGAWAEAYSAILQEHAGGIQAYQEYVTGITSIPVCRPVGIMDLTGDAVPELLFLDLVHDEEYGFELGRLWIYTLDGEGVHCALTLQPEIDDLLYSRYYLDSTGLLTVHLSDMEMGWILQLRPGLHGIYTAENTLIEQADFSGESPDAYFQNGKKITAKKYKAQIAEIQAAQGVLIGSLQVEEGGCGFTHTLAEALENIISGKLETAQQPPSPSGGELPALSFFKGSFTAGEKYAVYSAPGTKSWRGANGKAAITSGSEIFVAGTEEGWILILYELDSGVIRAGYIQSGKISGEYTSGDALTFPRTQMTLTAGAVMTDDPVRQQTTIGKLKKGTKVTCLAEYRGLIYVEAKVSGKTARGFISPASLGLGK